MYIQRNLYLKEIKDGGVFFLNLILKKIFNKRPISVMNNHVNEVELRPGIGFWLGGTLRFWKQFRFQDLKNIDGPVMVPSFQIVLNSSQSADPIGPVSSPDIFGPLCSPF